MRSAKFDCGCKSDREELDILLSELLFRAGLTTYASLVYDAEISGITLDSRVIKPGDLFIGMSGMSYDGSAFLGQAIQSGAAAAVVARPHSDNQGIPLVCVPDLDRSVVADLVLAFYGDLSQRIGIIGITGTNGKTTTAHLIAHVLNVSKRKCGIIGTLNGERTTPESPELFRRITDEIESGSLYVAVEVSSIALEQRRTKNVEFLVSVFTNLSQDHLDFHHNMAAYFASKARLFGREVSKVGVVNRDSDYGRELLKGAEIEMVGFGSADLYDVEKQPYRTQFTLMGVHFEIPLIGDHNLYNALSAIATLRVLGLSLLEVASALTSFSGVTGRLQRIISENECTVYVDYAHSPDALLQAISAVRNTMYDDQSLIVVFGAGGNRDRTKRSQMGYLAASRAQMLIITNDNPRLEDPVAIADSIIDGIREASSNVKYEVIYDRRRAIFAAIEAAGNRDVVLIAGKGHETYQTIGDATIYFSDIEVAKEALESFADGIS